MRWDALNPLKTFDEGTLVGYGVSLNFFDLDDMFNFFDSWDRFVRLGCLLFSFAVLILCGMRYVLRKLTIEHWKGIYFMILVCCTFFIAATICVPSSLVPLRHFISINPDPNSSVLSDGTARSDAGNKHFTLGSSHGNSKV